MNKMKAILGFTTLMLIFVASARVSSALRIDGLDFNVTYDPSVRPPATNGSGPVVVTVNTYVRSISEIDDNRMEYSVQLTFRQQWNDPRLKYTAIPRRKYLTCTDIPLIWIPDIFFSNEKSGHFHNMLMPNNLLRIYPDGEVLYSTRISLTLACPMNLRNFPMDVQNCQIVMASYGYTTEDIVFTWKAGDPVQVSKNLHLPHFTLRSFVTDYCTSRTNTGTYSCIKVSFNFLRELSFYLHQIYVPSIVLVILSWVSLWLNRRATTARLTIGVAVILSLVIKVAGIGSNLPATSYCKAVDVWTTTCLAFVFAVLLELIWVRQCVTDEDKQESNEANDSLVKELLLDQSAENKQNPESKSVVRFVRRVLNKYSSRGQRIDVISRVIFPLAFALFNLIYWTTYQQDNNVA